MADFRESFDVGSDENFRIMFSNLQRHLHTTMVGIVSEASDGHNVSAVPAVRQVVVDPTRTQVTYEDFPLVQGMPAHFPGGGGTALTHPHAVGDAILMLAASRAFGFWRQMDGMQQPETDRTHSLSDCVALGGVRSDPKRLAQVAPDAMHLRDDPKHAVHEVKPGVGVQSFHADPSTPAASDSFDPLSQASTFYNHVVQSGAGVVGQAVSPAGTHSHGVTHAGGAFMRALGMLHQVLCHPGLGALLSAENGQHTVAASSAGVLLQSATSIGLECPPGGLSLPSGGVSSGALAQGAASANVGQLGGDLAGTLPSPQVVSLAHVAGQNTALVQAASDSAAATAGVGLGSLYVNTAVKSGVGVLAVRLT